MFSRIGSPGHVEIPYPNPPDVRRRFRSDSELPIGPRSPQVDSTVYGNRGTWKELEILKYRSALVSAAGADSLAATAGCGRAPTLASGRRTIRSGGQSCARANVFRGVVLYAGEVLSGCEGGTQPIAYFGIHGLRDTTLSIAGGRSMRDRFVGNNGCTPQNPPEPAQGSLTHLATYCNGCRAGYPAVWGAFDGPHAPNAVDGSADPYAPGAGSWTQQAVWRFITQLGPNPPSSSPPSSPPPTSASPSSPAPSGACQASYGKINSLTCVSP
jgi:hypothetical protein